MNRIANTALSNQDISSPLLAATYTADADRELLVALSLSGLAGNGAYRACLTRQVGGAGPVYQSGTTAVAVAATVTTAYLLTTALAVESGDVVRVYVQGLAGDTAVGVLSEVFDVQTGLALEATGQEIKAKTSNLPSDPAAVGSAMTLTTGERVTLVAAVWSAAGRTLTSFSTLVADVAVAVWAAAIRTLTTPAQTASTQATAGALEIVRAVTYSATLTGVSFPATWTDCYFTVKRAGYETDGSDEQALLQLKLSQPADPADGLVRLNGGVATAAQGSLTADEGAGTLTIWLADEATLELGPAARLAYDVKFIDAQDDSTRERLGTLTVVATPTATV